MAAADRIRDADKAVGAQRLRQLLLDATDQVRPLEHQRRLDLHQEAPARILA